MHDYMKYCPVLLKIESAILGLFNIKGVQYHYLLQVWDSENQMVYERMLIKPVKAWSINEDFLIYKPDGEADEGEYIFLVNL
jgi:hypothetical protein